MKLQVTQPNNTSTVCLFCPGHEFGWHYEDVGHGPPLILLHGIGMSHFAWKTIINNLAKERRVLAFDIPGFGITPPVPDNIQPTPANLVSGASSLAETLSRIDEARQISKEYECVDIVGNSLGWKQRRSGNSAAFASSLSLLSHPPAYGRSVIRYAAK